MLDISTEGAAPPWRDIPATGPLLRPLAAAEYLGITKSSYYRLAKTGDLPLPVRIGQRFAGVPKPWLDAIIASHAEAA